MLEVTIGISALGFLLVGIGVAFGMNHRRKMLALRIKEAKQRMTKVSARDIGNLTDDDIGDLLGRSIFIRDTDYRVMAVDKHHSDDDGKPDEREYWWVLTCHDSVEDETVHLSCQRDDNGVWNFYLFIEVPLAERRKITELADVSWDGDEGIPPKELTFQGQEWSVCDGEFDQRCFVFSRHAERAGVDEYETQATEYVGAEVNQLMSLELWNTKARNRRHGGGMSLSIGDRLLYSEVRLFPEDEEDDDDEDTYS
jgi:hypothetical protein